jgi:hypothetical protein
MRGRSKTRLQTPEDGVYAQPRPTRNGKNGAAQRVVLAIACMLIAACSTEEDASRSANGGIAETDASSGATGGTTGTGGTTADAQVIADAALDAPQCYQLQDNTNCPAFAPYKFYCPANAAPLHFTDPGITCTTAGEFAINGGTTGCCTGNR